MQLPEECDVSRQGILLFTLVKCNGHLQADYCCHSGWIWDFYTQISKEQNQEKKLLPWGRKKSADSHSSHRRHENFYQSQAFPHHHIFTLKYFLLAHPPSRHSCFWYPKYSLRLVLKSGGTQKSNHARLWLSKGRVPRGLRTLLGPLFCSMNTVSGHLFKTAALPVSLLRARDVLKYHCIPKKQRTRRQPWM